jgi:hypothetical protein
MHTFPIPYHLTCRLAFSSLQVILLTKEYQASQFNRAEATAAANLGVPIIVGCSDPHLELAPWVLPMLGEDPFILDLSQVRRHFYPSQA